jgi:hypothetical protein
MEHQFFIRQQNLKLYRSLVAASEAAAAVDNMNIKPVALPEGGRLTSFDLGGISGQYEAGGNEGGNCDS